MSGALALRALAWGFVTLTAAGCTRQAPPEAPQSVSWYVEHTDERELKRTWCGEDAARQASSNCINAQAAWHRVNLKPNAKSFADDLKFK